MCTFQHVMFGLLGILLGLALGVGSLLALPLVLEAWPLTHWDRPKAQKFWEDFRVAIVMLAVCIVIIALGGFSMFYPKRAVFFVVVVSNLVGIAAAHIFTVAWKFLSLRVMIQEFRRHPYSLVGWNSAKRWVWFTVCVTVIGCTVKSIYDVAVAVAKTTEIAQCE